MLIRKSLQAIKNDKYTRTATGALRVEAVVSRVGVLEYQDEAGRTTREFRPADEVLDPRSFETLRGLPVTVEHPVEQEVNARTWKSVAVGHVTDAVEAVGDKVHAEIVIQDAATIEKVLRGELLALSPGYAVELEQSPGVSPEHGSFDHVQRDIVYNHMALLPPGTGRQGSSVQLRLDSTNNIILTRRDEMDEEIQAVVEEAALAPEDLAVKVREALSEMLPEMVKAIVMESMSAPAQEPVADEMDVVGEESIDGEVVVEDMGMGMEKEDGMKKDTMPEELKEDEAIAPEEQEKMNRNDAAERAGKLLRAARAYERVSGKRADSLLSGGPEALLRAAAEEAGLEIREDVSAEYLEGFLEASANHVSAKPAFKRVDSAPEPEHKSVSERWFDRQGK